MKYPNVFVAVVCTSLIFKCNYQKLRKGPIFLGT